jgi:hypothetical protein
VLSKCSSVATVVVEVVVGTCEFQMYLRSSRSSGCRRRLGNRSRPRPRPDLPRASAPLQGPPRCAPAPSVPSRRARRALCRPPRRGQFGDRIAASSRARRIVARIVSLDFRGAHLCCTLTSALSLCRLTSVVLICRRIATISEVGVLVMLADCRSVVFDCRLIVVRCSADCRSNFVACKSIWYHCYMQHSVAHCLRFWGCCCADCRCGYGHHGVPVPSLVLLGVPAGLPVFDLELHQLQTE